MKPSTDTRRPGYSKAYAKKYRQHKDLAKIAGQFVAKANSLNDFISRMGNVVRQAYNEVIDMPRTGRWTVAELAKTEKTYIGTKIEHLAMHEFSLAPGMKLDILFEGHEIDIKNTIGNNWSIPLEAVGEICIVIAGDDEKNIFSLGLFRALEIYLNPGANRDRKRTISPTGMASVFWIARHAPMGENFMASLAPPVRDAILKQTTGAARIRELFRKVTLRLIHRDVIEGLAQQKDALKRVRKNGGARDHLLREGILLLSGKYDHELLGRLGFPNITHDQYVSIPSTEVVRKLGPSAAKRLLSP